jgi:hypothetical protein
MLKLKSIKLEAAACRKAFKGVPVGSLVLHCHHELLMEKLTEPAEDRIAYILSDKPEHEQALRLRLFRPLTPASKTYATASVMALVMASKNYEEAIALTRVMARKAYDEVIAPASKSYDEDMASKTYATARKSYDEAIAPSIVMAHKAYDKAYATALAPASKAYDEATAPAHAKICVKGCPWNGETIFLKRALRLRQG